MRRYGVANLSLNRVPRADKLEVVGKGEQPSEFRNTQATVVSVEGSNVRARVSLNRWRRAIGVELEQK